MTATNTTFAKCRKPVPAYLTLLPLEYAVSERLPVRHREADYRHKGSEPEQNIRKVYARDIDEQILLEWSIKKQENNHYHNYKQPIHELGCCHRPLASSISVLPPSLVKYRH
ncbi:MAG: hypothetical protein Ct9H300mP14_02840 [Gammaproteobacteria bacterium]|nr:MAG: hypothetical protein Ct9H300mP14_02840 [Gammaproteobacteria bacterium]